MQIKARQLAEWVIAPTLKHIGMYSESAVNLLLGTAAQESNLGNYLHQVEGPALGIYQIEPATHADVENNYLRFRPDLHKRVRDLVAFAPSPEQQVITNLAYATAVARVIYYRRPEALPAADDINGLAAFWKAHYNTPLGAGTERQFVQNWHRFIL